PMMSMEDAIRGTLQLMDAPSEALTVRTSYNLHGCDFSPIELEAAIRAHVPDFAMTFAPDHRQGIAASWPNSIDDSAAQQDWGWKAEHDVASLVEHIFQGLEQPA
ncbi:MAG: NAD-dependent epimerase, partial [Flavobacteriales bacterium]|nr:NAD-dependent epimerase [Flavobacteriales bacterium]